MGTAFWLSSEWCCTAHVEDSAGVVGDHEIKGVAGQFLKRVAIRGKRDQLLKMVLFELVEKEIF